LSKKSWLAVYWRVLGGTPDLAQTAEARLRGEVRCRDRLQLRTRFMCQGLFVKLLESSVISPTALPRTSYRRPILQLRTRFMCQSCAKEIDELLPNNLRQRRTCSTHCATFCTPCRPLIHIVPTHDTHTHFLLRVKAPSRKLISEQDRFFPAILGFRRRR
jgi:hypothetical protein